MKMSWDKSETDKMADAIMEKAGIRFVSEAEAIEILQQRISTLESALVEIRDHPHCDDDCTEWCDGSIAQVGDYDDGIRSGHRCCAAIADRVLPKNEEVEK